MKTMTDKRDEQRTLLEEMGGALDDLKKRLDRMWKLHFDEFGEDEEYVRDGAFTEAGRKRLKRFFEEGARNMEIAGFFGVTDAAIAYHRKRWTQLEALRMP